MCYSKNMFLLDFIINHFLTNFCIWKHISLKYESLNRQKERVEFWGWFIYFPRVLTVWKGLGHMLWGEENTKKSVMLLCWRSSILCMNTWSAGQEQVGVLWVPAEVQRSCRLGRIGESRALWVAQLTCSPSWWLFPPLL